MPGIETLAPDLTDKEEDFLSPQIFLKTSFQFL